MAVVAVGRVLKLIGEKFKINCQSYSLKTHASVGSHETGTQKIAERRASCLKMVNLKSARDCQLIKLSEL
jgi:hypothetical protein